MKQNLFSLSATCLALLASVATAETKLGDLVLDDAFTRATLPNAPVAGGFVNITNTGDSDDRLVAATTDIAGTTEIHTMEMDNDIMRMRELQDGLAIPAGETVVLAPGGYHLMFMQLKAPLVEGDTVSVTLTFEQAGDVTLELPIGAMNAHGGGHNMGSN